MICTLHGSITGRSARCAYERRLYSTETAKEGTTYIDWTCGQHFIIEFLQILGALWSEMEGEKAEDLLRLLEVIVDVFRYNTSSSFS